MPADTQYILTAKLERQIGSAQGGTFGIVNNDAHSHEIWVTVQTIGSGPQGDIFYIRGRGDTLTLDRAEVVAVTIQSMLLTAGIYAPDYPATILLVDTDLTVSVTSLSSAVAGGV